MNEHMADPTSTAEINLGANLPPGVVPIVPMRNLVLFPQVLAPITIGRPRSVAAVARAISSKDPLIVVLQRDPTVDDPGLSDLHPVGTLARDVHDILPAARGRRAVRVALGPAAQSTHVGAPRPSRSDLPRLARPGRLPGIA